MYKLLSANFNYYIKNKLFWIETIFCTVFSAWVIFANYSSKIQMTENRLYLENVFFNVYQIFSVMLAIYVSLMVGTEYSDGTIRNKLIVGCTRYKIYFSMLFINIFISIIMMVIHSVVSFIIGYYLFGFFHIGIKQLIVALFCVLLDIIVFIALFVAISLNCSNKSITVVISLVLSMVITFIANFIGNRLTEPEMINDGVVITADGVQFGDLIKNPNYISGITKKIYEFIYDLLPSAQLIQIQSLNFTHWNYWIIFSFILFIIITMLGYYFFHKKDIK